MVVYYHCFFHCTHSPFQNVYASHPCLNLPAQQITAEPVGKRWIMLIIALFASYVETSVRTEMEALLHHRESRSSGRPFSTLHLHLETMPIGLRSRLYSSDQIVILL